MEIEIIQIPPAEAPMDLIYEADESPESVADYIGRGTIFAAHTRGQVVGEYIFLHTRPFTAEIVNIAVGAAYRNRGIATRLIRHAVAYALSQGFKILEIATANGGISQIRLYQKCGFRITHIDLDYIARLYPFPIVENGIECRDMVRMSMLLVPPSTGG